MAAKPVPRIPSAPDLPPRSALTSLGSFQPVDEDQIELCLIADAKSAGTRATHIRLTESVLQNTDLSDSEISFLELTDIAIENTDLTNSRWDWLAANRILFRSSKLVGFKAIEAEFLSARFTDCLMQFAQFRFAKLAGSYFENCDLRSSDFSGADLTGATFDRCILTGTAFSEAKCARLDLRSSVIDGLVIGPAELTGVIINPAQSAEIVRVFGVMVHDEHLPLPKDC